MISIANRSPIMLPENTPIEIILTHIANGINLIPLIDGNENVSIGLTKQIRNYKSVIRLLEMKPVLYNC